MVFRREIIVVAGITAISLGLNAVLVDRLVAFRFRGNLAPQERFEAQLDAIWQALPETDQAAARDVVSRQHVDLLNKWRATLSGGRQAAVALRAPSFDQAMAASAFGQLNQALGDYQLSLESMKVDIAGRISEEGRLHLSLWGPSPRNHR